jgi:uncharacterized protein
MPLIEGLRVTKSRIHGYGIVATRDYKAGDTVADVDGVPLRLSEVVDDEYCLWINDDMYFDMVDQTRWINHSCNPNCEIEGEEDPVDGRVWARVLALTDIRAGQELTYDYGFSLAHAMPCRCGEAACRGWIVDSEELPQLMARLAASGNGAASISNEERSNAALAGA